ncbi:type II and III secretion system protein family protein [Belnapia sp. T6]|uniref:Type II and III secretion system protein family protein n=1 Tax=Belnapia mucosa TaxID=2804532 RepID=A0ABS1V649_9PROT|nr:type II and III secretion system protein family protein [Belnapia mucosa]MBL6457166.1 type II and III secretion system protein family protein [Belnapia mucosa]
MSARHASPVALLALGLLALGGPAAGQTRRADPLEVPPWPRKDTQRAAPTAVPAATGQPVPVLLEAGAGRLLQLPGPAITVMASDPRIARVQPASPTSLFVMAVAAGRTTVVALAENGTPVVEYDITVQPGRAAAAPAPAAAAPAAPAGPATTPPPNPAAVQSMIRRMVRGAEGVQVAAAGTRGLLLSGEVPSAAEAQRAEAIARVYGGEEREVINDLSLLSSIQVNLRVRVAEISRQVSRELGFNWQDIANSGSGLIYGLQTGGVGTVLNALTSRPFGTDAQVGRLGLGYRSSRFDINSVVDALASDQLITILAEPNLTAQSGEVASFLAGGEFPVPIAASSVNNSITIEYKQFGVSLAFVPTVLGPERLNLRVRPEVSELSSNGAVSLPLGNGVVQIPALAVRRAETTVELGSGQSFAIAGLLQRNTTLTNSGLNGLGDIPVIGALYRSDRFRRGETELVIIITPYLVRPVSNPRALAAPTDGFQPATNLDRVLFRRQVARGRPATPPRGNIDAGFILE